MATVKEVYAYLNEKAPFYSQMSFDNAGFLVGRSDKQVKRILVALDITEAVANEAAQLQADLIVSHHPVIWEGAKSVTDETILGRKLLALITHDISAICAHTNLDAAKGGVNDCLAAALGLRDTQLLKVYGTYEDGTPYGIEQVGTVDGNMPLTTFAAQVKEKLGSNGVRYVDAGKPVCKVAVGGGSCSGSMKDVLAVGCTLGAEDAVIAGEAVGALDLNDLAILDVGIDAALRAGGTDIADSVANFDPCFFTGDLCFYESLQFSHGRHLRSIQ